MKPLIFTLCIVLTVLLTACNFFKQKEPKATNQHTAALCDSIGFDCEVLTKIEKYNTGRIERFHYSWSKEYRGDSMIEIDPIRLPGLVFPVPNKLSYKTVYELKDQLYEKGYTIFILENNFGINNQKDVLAVLKDTNKLSVLKQIGTSGVNYDITNDSLCRIIQAFDQKYELQLIGASGDWCEFVFRKNPSSWEAMADEVYSVCPDVVEQGTGTKQELANTLRTYKKLYFWWD